MDVKGVCLWKTRIQIIWKTNQKKDAVATRPSIVRKKEYKDLMNRLSRIEGQVRGIKGYAGEGCLLSGDPGTGVGSECGIEQLQ